MRVAAGLALRASAIALVLHSSSAGAEAQAWVPPKGEGSVSFLVTNVLVRDHLLPTERYDRGHIDSTSFLFDVTYGVSDRLAVTASLPVIMTRYRGAFPHQPITIDDGSWHTTAQDFRIGVRYNVVRGPVVVTPFVGSVLPSGDYSYYAHAAAGRRVREMLAGVTVGKLFANQGLVLQGRYAFGVAERVVGFTPLHSEAGAELAYFLTPAIRVFGSASGRLGHNGIDLTLQSRAVLPPQIWLNHDRVSRIDELNVGGGAAFSVSESIDLFGAFSRTVAGRNTHAVDRGISVGMAWSFRRSGAARTSSRENSLAKCLCQKAGE